MKDEVYLVENKFTHAGVAVDWSPLQVTAWRRKDLAEELAQKFINNGTVGEFRVAKYKRVEEEKMSTQPLVEQRIEGASADQQIVVVMSLCTHERLAIIAKHATACRNVEGEFFEMGVYMGGSAGLIGRIGPAKKLLLFDSFEGVSEPDDKDAPTIQVTDGPMWQGEWRGDMKRALINIGRDCIIFKGWIPERFKDVPEGIKVAFAHVDLDLYQPTKDSLEFILPRLGNGGIIIVDDFDFPRHPGIRTAIEELLPVWPKLRGRVEVAGQVVLYLEE